MSDALRNMLPHCVSLIVAFMVSGCIFIPLVINAQSCPLQSLTCTSTTVSVPNPWYQLTFASNPSTTNPSFASSIQYNATDSAENGCTGFRHSGMITLTGGTSPALSVSNTNLPYIDLLATSGANSAGTALPGNVGGASNGTLSLGTYGWSFEVTFKPLTQTNWAKLIMLGNGPGVSDLIFGWNDATGGNTEMDWNIIDGSSNGNFMVIPGVSSGLGPWTNIQTQTQLNQWYHIVLVVSAISNNGVPSPNVANWFMYVNGTLLIPSYTSQQPYITRTSRPYSYLGRSNWVGDALFNARIDTFRIYDVALDQEQVTALYQSELGGCALSVYPTSLNVPVYSSTAPNLVSTSSSLTSLTTTFSLPSSNPNNPNASYSWLTQDAEDTVCGISTYHQQILALSGDPNLAASQYLPDPYVNLSSATGPNSLLTTMGTIGGASSGVVTAATAGWTLELTFKPGMVTYAGGGWSYMVEIGGIRAAATSGRCSDEIAIGYIGGTQNMQIFLCDTNGNVANQLNAIRNLQPGTWYHLVWTQQLNANGFSNWYIWVNGVLTGVNSNALYFPAVNRPNARIGESGWVADSFWGGLIDTFSVYNWAVSDAQVQQLFLNAMGPAGQVTCGVFPVTTSYIDPAALIFSATFDTNPAIAAGTSTPNYGWEQVDPTDPVITGVRNAHTGILLLNGCTAGSCAGQYVNLSASSGSTSIGKVLPNIGGLSTGSMNGGTYGWSFEVTYKVYSQQAWAKMFEFTDGVQSTPGVWDILMGWHSTDMYYSVSVSELDTTQQGGINSANANPQATPPLSLNTWYHTVWVIQYAVNASIAADFPIGNFYIYHNGALAYQWIGAWTGTTTGDTSTVNYPPLARRVHSVLGKSQWGDSYWIGAIDTFNVYSRALTSQQALGLYEIASTPTGFTCEGAGYNMNSLGNQTFTYVSGGYTWTITPCGTASACGGGNVCQGTTLVSAYTPAINPVIWQQITGGVQMSVSNGASCTITGQHNNQAFPRTGIIQFICSETAPYPYIQSITEGSAGSAVGQCTYIVVILTMLACQVPATNLGQVIGEPFYSPQCGGGIYDLTPMNFADLSLAAPASGWLYALRPCNATITTPCPAGTSFCQYNTAHTSFSTVASWSGTTYASYVSAPPVWTLTPQGIQLQLADGAACGSGFPRVGIINFNCNPSARPGILVTVVEASALCHYTAYVDTYAVCTRINQTSVAFSATGTELVASTTGSTGVLCGGAGFDMTSLMRDFSWTAPNSSPYTYTVHPCGPITVSSPCGTTAMMCQSNAAGAANLVAVWAPNLYPPQWLQLSNGVQLTVQDGASCNIAGIQYQRAAVINFICDLSATTPILSYVYEIETCHYAAYIATRAACYQYSNLINTEEVNGFSYTSATCGGPFFPNLTSVNLDLAYIPNATDPNGFDYYVHVCGTVSASACSAVSPTSFCVVAHATSGGVAGLAVYNPSIFLPVYTVTNGGVIMSIQDGAACASINGAPTTGIFVFTCGSGISRITNVNQPETCHYFVYITTPYACGGPAGPVSSSSTASNIIRISSSSYSTAATINAPDLVSSSINTANNALHPTSSSPTANNAGPALGVTSSSSSSSSNNGDGNIGNGALSSSNSGLTHGQLAGAIIGPIIAAMICCLIFFCLFFRHGKGWKKHQDSGGHHETGTGSSTEPSYADGEHHSGGDETEIEMA